jgi:hypothetical protein
MQAPFVEFHNRTVLSVLALAKIIREGKNARFQTWYLWPEKVNVAFELARFQSEICPSPSPEAKSTPDNMKSDGVNVVFTDKYEQDCNKTQ